MVFLAITAGGLQDALRASDQGTNAIWCGADAISGSDYAALEHANVSRFTYPLQAQPDDVLAAAVNIIKEHHPGESVWVEQRA
jgi:hypothetical protein